MILNILDLLVSSPDRELTEPGDDTHYASYSGSDEIGPCSHSHHGGRLVGPAHLAPAWRAAWVDAGKHAIAYLDAAGRHAFTEYEFRLIPTDEFLARDADILLQVAASKWAGQELRLGGSTEFARVLALTAVQLDLEQLLEDAELANRSRNAWQFWPERRAKTLRASAAALEELRYEARVVSNDGLWLSHLALESAINSLH